jgi:hypothetical protein
MSVKINSHETQPKKRHVNLGIEWTSGADKVPANPASRGPRGSGGVPNIQNSQS